MFKCLVGICLIVCAVAFPSDIEKCKHDDEECLINRANSIVKNYHDGYDELGLIQIDPLKIDKVTIKQGAQNSPINLILQFQDANLSGLKDATFYKITGYTKNAGGNKLDVRYKLPSLSLTGPYTGKGKILVVPAYGSGDANITMMNVDVKIRMLTKAVENDGKTYLQIDKAKYDFNSTRLYMQFEGLFNGENKELEENLNKILNQNWKYILEELKPSIVESFGKVFQEAINKIFMKTPYDELFLQ